MATEEENRIKPAKSELKNSTIVETYADDMARVLENDTEGLVKKIIKGEEQHEAEKKNLSPESKKNKFFIFVSIFLVGLGISVLSFVFLREEVNTVPVREQFIPPIFTDAMSDLDISGLKKEEIAKEVAKKVSETRIKIGDIESIYIKEGGKMIGLRRLLLSLKSNFVPPTDTYFLSDNFLLGVVNIPSGENRLPGEGFFLLLKMSSVADVFDSLRTWERKMFLDLHELIGINLSSETEYLLTKDFEDGVVDNKNARILSDKDGNIVLAYVYANENSIIITNSANAVHEVALRLGSASKKQ